jgi:hypothetical protein
LHEKHFRYRADFQTQSSTLCIVLSCAKLLQSNTMHVLPMINEDGATPADARAASSQQATKLSDGT